MGFFKTEEEGGAGFDGEERLALRAGSCSAPWESIFRDSGSCDDGDAGAVESWVFLTRRTWESRGSTEKNDWRCARGPVRHIGKAVFTISVRATMVTPGRLKRGFLN